jgi:hypothetical protein
MAKKAITTPKGKAIGPYSMAIDAGDLIFISGQIPLDPATGNVEATSLRRTQSLENSRPSSPLASLCARGQDYDLPHEHGRFRLSTSL